MTKLFLIDPNPVALAQVELLCEGAGFTVVGGARDCVSGCRGIESSHAHLVVADPYNCSHATRKGAAAMADLVERFPKTKFVVFSLNPPDVFAARALRAGAKAYVSKTRPDQLISIIRAVAAGEMLPTPIIFPEVPTDINPLLVLAPRQLETLVLTGSGYKTRDVAALFSRSTKTVDTHKDGIKARLKIPHHVALATYAACWLRENPLLAYGVSHPPLKTGEKSEQSEN